MATIILRRGESPVAPEDAGLLARARASVDAWVVGRSWAVRAPLVLFLVYVGVRQFADDDYASVFGAINLGIHEAGHFVFASLGAVLHAAGGTILQCAAPVASAAMFLRQPDWFAASVCLGWLSTNLHHVGTYMADAEAMRLPLVTVGPADSVTHDWRFLFERFDVLHHCEAIGAAMHGLAHVAMAASVASGAWLLVRMWKTVGRSQTP
jgi:hypothetical protein